MEFNPSMSKRQAQWTRTDYYNRASEQLIVSDVKLTCAHLRDET